MGQNFDQAKLDNNFWPMPTILKGNVPQPGSHCNWKASPSTIHRRCVHQRHRGMITKQIKCSKAFYASWSRPRKPSLLIRMGLWPQGYLQIQLPSSGKINTLVCEPQNKQTYMSHTIFLQLWTPKKRATSNFAFQAC